MEWNINGWFSDKNPYYLEFKTNVIKYLCADFIVLTETHCMEHQVINIDNYTVVQKNRPIVNVNAKKRFGRGCNSH